MSKLQVDDIVNKDDTGGVGFSKGVVVTGITTATSFDGDLTGNADTATYAPTAGIATNAQGLTGTPNLNVGIVTATEFSGDGSNLDNIKSGITTFIASGTISNGNTVIINTDGTVSAVSGTGSGKPTVGINTVFDTNQAHTTSATFDSSNNKVVVAYTDANSNHHGMIVVGTVTGTDIEFGTPLKFKSSNCSSAGISVVFDSNTNRVVLLYGDVSNSQQGVARVCTVSGNSISLGNEQVFPTFGAGSNIAQEISAVFDPDTNKVIVAYNHYGNSSTGLVVIGTVTGGSTNTISFGTPVNSGFPVTNFSNPKLAYDSNLNKVIIVYRSVVSSPKLYVSALTIDGANSTYTHDFSATVREGDQNLNFNVVFDSTNNKIVVIYSDNGNADYGTAVVGTVSATGIILGTPVVFESADVSQDISAVYDPTNNKVVIAYGDVGNSQYGTVIDGTVTGTDITFGPPVIFESATSTHLTTVLDSNSNKVVAAYLSATNSDSNGIVVTPTNLSTNLTRENYIGIAAEAIADGATGKVNIVGGINSSQTGLTTAQKYYANPIGGLSLDPIIETSDVPGIPVVVAGNSISSTKIIINETSSPDVVSSSGSGGSASYGNNDVDAHLNRDGTVGVSSVLGWNGNDYNWQPPGGAWQLISTITASGASTVDFTSGIDSTYRRYVILGSEIQVVTGTTNLYMRVFENGTLYQTANYHQGSAFFVDFAVGWAYDEVVAGAGTAQSYIDLSDQGGGFDYPGTLELIIDNPSASKTHYKINSKVENGAAQSQRIVWCSASLISQSALTNVDGIRLYPATGTMNGTFKLYGIK